MTANLRLTPLNHWDAATLSTSAAPATGFPILNTQNSTRGLVCRTTSSAAQSWMGTWSASPIRTATHFSMYLHTMGGIGSTGTIRLQLFSDPAWSVSVFDSGALSANDVTPTDVYDFGISNNDPFAGSWPYGIYFAEKTFRSATISFAGTPLNAYWQASRIFLGKHLEVTINPDFGATLGWMDQSDRNRSRGGSLRTSVGPSWRVMNMDLSRLAESQRAAMLDIYRYSGTSRDLVFDLFPDDTTRLRRDHFFLGKFASLNAIGRQVSYLTTKLQVEEV